MEAGIDAVRVGDQLPVRAFLDQLPMRQHDDVVGVDDRRKPVRDDDRRAAVHHFGKRCLHARLGFIVERRGRLVEHQDRRVADDGAGDRQALALAARQRHAVFADRRLVAVRLLADEVVGLGDPCGLLDLGVGRVGAAVADVVADRAFEQIGLLRDIGDRPRSDCLVTSAMSWPSIAMWPAPTS